MAAAVLVRGDYDAAQMRELAKRSEDAAQTRRLLALAARQSSACYGADLGTGSQQHGGTIEVDSRVGEFTEFTIRLPRQ